MWCVPSGCKEERRVHRPIVVGEVLRRLTSKCFSTAVRAEVIRILIPLQVGVGVREGCEAIIHSVARILEREDLDPDSRWILLDFSNAFNSISRECMFEEIRSRIPSLSRWVESCYGAQPILHFGWHTVLSCCGVQQGDPLCFAFTLQPIIEKLLCPS